MISILLPVGGVVVDADGFVVGARFGAAHPKAQFEVDPALARIALGDGHEASPALPDLAEQYDLLRVALTLEAVATSCL